MKFTKLQKKTIAKLIKGKLKEWRSVKENAFIERLIWELEGTHLQPSDTLQANLIIRIELGNEFFNPFRDIDKKEVKNGNE